MDVEEKSGEILLFIYWLFKKQYKTIELNYLINSVMTVVQPNTFQTILCLVLFKIFTYSYCNVNSINAYFMHTALRLFKLFKYVHIDIFWPKRNVPVKFSLLFALLLKLYSLAP